MNYYPHHIGDFNNATRHLTRVERSLYRELIELYYSTEQPLPANDFNWLCKKVLASSDEEIQAVSAVLGEFFERDGDVWRHNRCDEEIAVYKAKHEVAVKAGKISAELRANAKPTTVERPLSKRATNQEPITKNQEPRTKEIKTGRKRPCVSLPEGFCISDRVKAWAAEHGFSSLEKHLAYFLGYVRANGKTYADWDQAFMNAIRDDWAKVRANAAPDYSRLVAEGEAI